MHLTLAAGLSCAAILLSSFCANAAGDDQMQSSAGACSVVASAKFAQWNQQKFMIRETKTFADGRKKTVEAILTPDLGYARVDGGPWTSMNLVQRQRAARSPDDLLKRMGLQDCGLSGPDESAKQPVSIYSYGYRPDSQATQVTGKMWIDSSSQLPIRQELAQPEASQRNLPVSIEASYTYGDSVAVPTDAVRSDERRRWIEQQTFFRNRGANGSGGSAGNPTGFRHH